MNFEVVPVRSVLSYGAVGAIRGWIPTPEFPERVGFCQIIRTRHLLATTPPMHPKKISRWTDLLHYCRAD